ncbi:hypothetical protein [Amycolatopsis eburnea]|uniref:Uncharacterized protein n=1 Tax=Amycolatopsis eburnea TaxID=2267691 RepID=A0A3R9DPT1_9PSEU|nr:hypothetical protein [Amycolatopsis eburnea]RSD23950.1 hypothetical protein EIY87_06155 [Amycolatopsis eburnea]
MPEGFRIASAFVEVNLHDNTEADERRIRARLEKGGPISIRTILDDPDGLEKVKERVRRSSPAKLPLTADNPIDDAWRAKVESSLKATAKQALKIPATPDGEKFRRDLAAVIGEVEKGLQAEIPADLTDAAKFRSEVETLAKIASEETRVRIKAEIDQGTIESEAEKAAARVNSKFRALTFAALSAGLPAAAAIGTAGAVAALSAIPAVFVGIGAAALKGNVQVADSFAGLKSSVVSDTQAMAAVLSGPLSGAADDLQASFKRLRPAIQTAFAESGPVVDELTGSVTDLAENAMPGMVTAIGNSEGALQGFRSLTGQTGAGLSDFLRNLSQGSDAAGQSMTIFGGTVRSVEAALGMVLANLASGAAGPLRSFDAMVNQVAAGLGSLTGQGSGALGFLQGFTNVGTGTLTVLRGLAAAVSALPPGVTQMAGSIAAANMITSKFGLDAGKAFEGLGTRVRDAGKDLDGAAKWGTKFGTALGGLVGGALNPATIAVALLGTGLDILGQKQAKAAQAAAEHRENVRLLTDAIRADNGAIDEQTAKANVAALNSKNAAANVSIFGANLATATAAANGHSEALDTIRTKSDAWIQSLLHQGVESQRDIDGLKNLNHQVLENGGSYDSVAGDVAHFNESLAATHPQLQKQLQALYNGTGAVGEQARATRDAYAAYLLEEQGLYNVSEAQIKARDSTTQHTAAIHEQVNASLGYRGAVLNTKAALDKYNETQKNGKASADDKARAELALEQAMAQQEQAAYNAAYATSTAASADGKKADASRALNQETVNLANSFNGPLPASLQQTIGKMSATEAQAAGLKLGVNNLGIAVYTLPNGKTIVIESNADQQAAAMQNLRDKINQIPTNKKSTVEIVTIYKTVGTAAVRTGNNSPDVYLYGPHSAEGGLPSQGQMKRFAKGGPTIVDASAGGLLQGPGTGTSDDILTLFSNGMLGKTSDEEFVVNAEQTAKWYPLLMAINSGLKGFANGGLVQAEDGSWVDPSFYGPAPKGPHAIYTEQGFAKLRARADAYGFGSLSAKDQNQLRTYGGYAVTATQGVVAATAPAAIQALAHRYAGATSGQPAGGTATATSSVDTRGSDRTVVNITQNIYTMDPSEAARKSANEITWALRNR